MRFGCDDRPIEPWEDRLAPVVLPNLQVGHSYQLQGGRPLRDLPALKRVLRDDILPLLEEYCYEDFDALKNILGPGFVNPEGRRLRDDLFGDGQEDALIQARLTPDVETSAEAVAAGVGADAAEDEVGEAESAEGGDDQ